MSKICQQDTDKILLVEGIDDCHVVMNLCVAHQVPKTFGIYECGGKDQVLKRLSSLIVSSKAPQVIGVMLDADQSSLSRWQSIQDKLTNNNHNYVMPKIPNIDGTIIEKIEGKPKLGFWLMPNNQDSGILEDFCAKLAEPNSLKFAETCVKQASESNVTTFKEVDYSKAVIHTYLSWHDEPGYPLGKAITSQALRPQTEVAFKFTEWLKHLFT
ncbi:MAG: hypothetical protein KA717_38405 [Woronichinia naegeliana WA131]|jgi:hypothetical protein|uniref:Uncharacterized protein n=1 Tax=Woronichinia naegeliana WA131 TaxID=2824559 RepID=A0A977KWF9_9CYAN|nr:MAG: hypothetical protein KA717_38405 [Woronichinia naegeliana WA131]